MSEVDALVKKYFYNPITGEFTIRETGKPVSFEMKFKHTDLRYIVLRIGGYRVTAHRAAFVFMTGDFPDGDVDHIDHNGLNNKWENLRVVTHSVNIRNSRLSKANKSGIKGVRWEKEKKTWKVSIGTGTGSETLGRYKCFFNACCRRKSAENHYGY